MSPGRRSIEARWCDSLHGAERERCASIVCPTPRAIPTSRWWRSLSSGLDGMRQKMDPGPPVNKDIFSMSQREKGRLRVQDLPGDLSEATRAFEKDRFLQAALGAHISNHIIEAKRAEWQEYIGQVHPWEIDRYLSYY